MALRDFSTRRARLGLGSAVVVLATAALTGPGLAQTTYIGGGGGSGVTVNQEVLDRLGQRQTIGRSALVIPLASDVVTIGGDIPPPLPALPPPPPVYATVSEPASTAPPPPPPPSPPPPAAIVAAQPTVPLPAQPLPGAEPVPVPELPTALAEPAEPAAEAAPEEPPPAQVATVTPTGSLDLTRQGTLLSLGFAAEEAELRPDATAALDALIVAMAADADARIQLVAYAGASASGGSAARRLSLSRALAVRAFLIERGVRSTRIDVRALGAKSDGGPTERVDVVALPR